MQISRSKNSQLDKTIEPILEISALLRIQYRIYINIQPRY